MPSHCPAGPAGGLGKTAAPGRSGCGMFRGSSRLVHGGQPLAGVPPPGVRDRNLIAAPLFRPARDAGAPVFLGLDTLERHQDQWAYLSVIGRMTPAELKRCRPRCEGRSRRPAAGSGMAWAMRWKPALNAFASTFGDRFPAAETY